MDDWQDVVSLVTGSLAIASLVAAAISIPIYVILRLVHSIPKLRKQHTWKSDLRPIYWISIVVLSLTFLTSLFIGSLFSDMCGTSDITEVLSPDARHKIVVYNFDCGATTDFSLDVSLLRANQKLPKYRRADLLYSHYHQRPMSTGVQKNFEILWSDPTHATVRVTDLDGGPKIKHQDGVEISFVSLH